QPSFPRGRESRPVGAETYREKKGFLRFYVLDSHFCGNDGSVATVTVRFRLCWNFGKLMNRHSRAGGNLEMKSSRNLSEMTETERTGFPLLRE
ncbi:hypothetical protein CS839_11535, partial [Neisseria gonorrhoeae]